MLAQQHGLALITEKLQNQRLEEPAAGSSGATPGATSFCGKLPTVNQETFLISDHHSGQSRALSVKGKNVWAMSLDAEGPNQASQQQNTSSNPHIQVSFPSSSAQPTEKDQSVPPPPSLSLCRHKKFRHFCQICDTGPSTPSAPPKKKHCRSLSVPPDGPSAPTFFPSGKDATGSPSTRFSIGIAGSGHPPHYHSHHHHHQQAHHHSSKIWRPIAVVPLRCSGASSNNNSGGSSTNTNSHNKERICPAVTHHYSGNVQNFVSHPGVANNDNNNNSSNPSSSFLASVSGIDDPTVSSSSSRLGSCSSLSLNKFKLMPPSSFSSSASFDSGHFTTSDLQTPPSSPIPQPRPASAASDASYSSVNWFDFSPMRSRVRVLQNRSLSCEDRISGCSSCSCSSPSSSSSSTTTSMPCVYNCSNPNHATGGVSSGTGRGSATGCCAYHNSGSSSEVVPRCHSQPCVLHHRRCGKKRRRDCDRPTLNFNKMTETAYMHPHRKSEPWSSPSYEAQMRLCQGHYGFNTPSRSQFFLNPIASSPLDSSEMLMTRHLQQPQVAYNSNDDTTKELRESLDNMDLAHTTDVSSGNRRQMEDKENDDDEEDEEEEDEERNCSCHDSQREPDSIGLFPMGDLDLEQIESH